MNENLNLVEILKDCPKGLKLYSTLFGEVELDKIKKESEYPIVIITKHGNNSDIKSDGRYYGEFDDGECTLFPSKGQRDWSKFNAPWYKNQPEPKFKVGDWLCANELNNYANLIKIVKIVDVLGKKRYKVSRDYDSDLDLTEFDFIEKHYHLWTIQDAKDGDVLAISWLEDKNLWEKIVIFKKYNSKGVEGYGNTFKNGEIAFTDEEVPYYSKTWACNLYPATKEQRNLLSRKIKEAGYKWNFEIKTLEKLVKPKFKVGDRIRYKETNKNKDDVYVISKVYDDAYGVAGFTWMIYMKYQDQYELVPNKFDPETLAPFDKVIVRDNRSCCWRCAFFSHIRGNEEITKYRYATTANSYAYCIPYNDDTKRLVNTNEDAPEYYRYWED